MAIGVPHYRFDATDSTNDRAMEYANDPDMDGAVFQALVQTAGRGQYGRIWQAQPGEAVLLSVLLFPPPSLCRPVLLTALAAVAVCETLAEIAGLEPKIKWPNDVLVDRKKICGILIESRLNRHRELAVVCGIGLNLNQTAREFAERGLPEATSLGMLTGGRRDVNSVTTVLLRHLNGGYGRLLRGDTGSLEAEWMDRLGLMGRSVAVEFADGGSLVGRIASMNFDAVVLDYDRRVLPETIRQIREIKE